MKLSFTADLEATDNDLRRRQEVVTAAETLDDMAKCHSNWFCKIDDFEDYRQPLRRFWFTFRPVIEKMRGTTVPRDFAFALEAEAKRTLAEDRTTGRLPAL